MGESTAPFREDGFGMAMGFGLDSSFTRADPASPFANGATGFGMTDGGGFAKSVFRWGDAGWTSFAQVKSAGCAEIRAADPKFPSALCKALPAPA